MPSKPRIREPDDGLITMSFRCPRTTWRQATQINEAVHPYRPMSDVCREAIKLWVKLNLHKMTNV